MDGRLSRRCVVAAALAAAVTYAGTGVVGTAWTSQAYADPAHGGPVAAGNNGTATDATFDFGGKKLTVPHSYLEMGQPGPYDLDQLYLRAYLPAFSARPAQPPRDGGHGDGVRVRVEAWPATLNISYARVAAGRADGPLAEQFGLKGFSTVPGRGGTMGGPYTKPDEVLLAHDGREVTTLIVCTPGYPSPPCKHEFRALGFGFTATYGMDHLMQWREIEDGIRHLMQRFGAS